MQSDVKDLVKLKTYFLFNGRGDAGEPRILSSLVKLWLRDKASGKEEEEVVLVSYYKMKEDSPMQTF